MKRILLSIFITLFIISFSVKTTYSQSPTVQPASSDEENDLPEGVESCFKYYDYAKVQVNLSSDKGSYKPGEKIKLQGTIVNSNTFPLTEVILYTQLRRVNEDTKSNINSGNFLVDRIVLKKDLNFLPNETKFIEIEVPILATYPGGSHLFEYFIFSKDGFHYGGRSFLEEEFAGTTLFSIENSTPLVFFDAGNFKVNGQNESIKDSSKKYNTNSFTFEIPIIDRRTAKSDLEAKIKYYYFEDDLENFLESSQSDIVRSGNQILQTTFSLPSDLYAAYMIVAEIDKPIKTVFKYRFTKQGTKAKELRINDLGVTDYPLKDTSQAYVCFHSPAFVVSPQTEVKLSILDSQKNPIDAKTVKSAFPPTVLAIALPLSKLSSQNDFYLKAELLDQSGNRELIKHYTDKMFMSSIKNIEIGHNVGNPGQITILPKDISGNTITNDGYIESIRIKNSQGDIVQEEYNVKDFSKPFNLGELPKGNYTVEVKSGNIISSKDFELTKDLIGSIGDGYVNKENLAKTITTGISSYLLIMLLLAIIIFCLGGLLFWRRRKIKRENNL